MENHEPRLCDVTISQLTRLDGFVKNRAALDTALGTKLDAGSDDERFLDAALALYGSKVQKTLYMLREGEPGFVYREAQRNLLATMVRGNTTVTT